MLGEAVGFLAKVAMWAFVIGAAVGIYLGVHYGAQAHAAGGDGVSCVVPAPAPPAGGPSG